MVLFFCLDKIHKFGRKDIRIGHMNVNYGKALKIEARVKHPFHLTTHTWYLHVIPSPNSGLKWIMPKPVGLLTAPGILTADTSSLMTQVI